MKPEEIKQKIEKLSSELHPDHGIAVQQMQAIALLQIAYASTKALEIIEQLAAKTGAGA